MDLQLGDKIAIVSGGASGIGAAIVSAFLEEGCRVAVFDLNPPQDPKLADHQNLISLRVQLEDSEACAAAVREVVERFGGVDILVNNAGTNDTAGLESGPSDFRKSLTRNLEHFFSLAHFCFEELKKRNGCIVNIGSKVGVTGQGGTSGYAAAKGAVNALTREWAVEGASCGVRANAVIPAEVMTPMYERWLSTQEDPDEKRHRIEQSIPLGRRFTRPEEIAAMTVFLSSPRSAHTTGQIIFVDGGYTHLDRQCTAEAS